MAGRSVLRRHFPVPCALDQINYFTTITSDHLQEASMDLHRTNQVLGYVSGRPLVIYYFNSLDGYLSRIGYWNFIRPPYVKFISLMITFQPHHLIFQ